MEIELIKSNIAGLTDEQYKAISDLSKRAESELVESKSKEIIGKIHQDYDNDMKALGFEKPEGKKSYEHIKDVVGKLKAEGENHTKEIARLKDEVGKGDDGLKRLLEDEKNRVKELQAKLDSETLKQVEMQNKFDTDLANYKIESEFDRAISEMTFADNVDSSLKALAIKQAKSEIMAELKGEWVDGVLMFRDANGILKNNPNNSLKPYTAGELIAEKSYIKTLLKTGRKAEGAGSKGGSGNGGAFLDLSGCKNRVEADEAIDTYLLGKGLTRRSAEYQSEFTKLRTEYKVSEMKLF